MSNKTYGWWSALAHSASSRSPFVSGRVLVACVVPGVCAALSAAQPFPPVPVPAENPITESKRVLGKILFWDEQLSSDNTMSCGSCHQLESGGNDLRVLRNPGFDGQLFTPDDVQGSPGMTTQDAGNRYVDDAEFGLGRQATNRTAPTVINAAFNPLLFWDGRATSVFTDPQTGEVSIVSGGALESLAVAPPLDSIEMSHTERDWDQAAEKLTTARPLALAVNLTADVSEVLSPSPSYPELFAEAFGDGAITAERIAFAIATYLRTLISDQAPWDAFTRGDPTALSPEQRAGWNLFQTNSCVRCHTPPLFTDGQFHNLGLRPIEEDLGRQGVTGNPVDAGRFKTQSLRNIGLKPTFMHTGTFSSIEIVIDSYVRVPRFSENVDPLLQIVNPRFGDVAPIAAFLSEGLLDPRVAAGEFPFDRPTLRSELPASVVSIGGGTAHLSTDVPPRIISQTPALLGSRAFKLGVTGVNEGELVTLLVSREPPIGGLLSPEQILSPVAAVSGDGNAPVATAFWPVPSDGRYDGETFYFQFETETGARSEVAQAELFCGNGECAIECDADTNGDGLLDQGDIDTFIVVFLGADLAADLNGDGLLDQGDIQEFVALFLGGCAV